QIRGAMEGRHIIAALVCFTIIQTVISNEGLQEKGMTKKRAAEFLTCGRRANGPLEPANRWLEDLDEEIEEIAEWFTSAKSDNIKKYLAQNRMRMSTIQRSVTKMREKTAATPPMYVAPAERYTLP
ncbi:unnamed protein product, partial [Owenia fusiformis]